jgi:hypothetical protein
MFDVNEKSRRLMTEACFDKQVSCTFTAIDGNKLFVNEHEMIEINELACLWQESVKEAPKDSRPF